MTILLKGERHNQSLTNAGGDKVICGFDLPADSVLREVSAQIDLVGVQSALERERATGYACAMYLIPLEDPDTAVLYDTIWDRFVPKYTDVDTIDLDTVASDATPFWEPGEANFDEIFDMGTMPLRLFMRRKTLNFARPGSGGLRFQPAETPFDPQWFPSDSFGIRLNKSIRTRVPSVVLIGLACPSYDDTTTSGIIHLLEAEWGQIQYIESTLERALMDQLNLVEPGAETPWENASVVIRKHLAPDVFEQTAAAWETETYNAFTQLNFEHTVPGSMSFKSVDITP